MPSDLDETDQQKFKRKVQLIALRFGINHVETVEKNPDAEEIDYPEAIWLRVPFMNSHDMGAEAANYGNVAVALANVIDDDSTHQPRLDIYNIPFKDPFGSGGLADPFAGGGPSDDPFGGGGGSGGGGRDPFSAGNNGDPFGASASLPSDVIVKKVSPQPIDEISSQAKLAAYTRRVEQLKPNVNAALKSGASAVQIRKVLLDYATAEYLLHTELQNRN